MIILRRPVTEITMKTIPETKTAAKARLPAVTKLHADGVGEERVDAHTEPVKPDSWPIRP